MENNDKLESVFQYIDDILAEIETNEKLLTETLNEELKRINEKINPFFKIIIGILAGIVGVLHVFAWRSNKKEIQKINDQKFL